MTTQEFLKKIPKEIRIGVLGCCRPLSELVLDPKVWEAVGKVEGWEIDYKSAIKYKLPNYKDKMHEMIDHLCEGNSIESYIKTL